MNARSNETGGEVASILNKAFELLYSFNDSNRVMTLSQLSRASGLPKSTVHRLLARLVDLGALEHHRSGYKLGLGLLQLGATTPAANMRELAIPFLVALQRWSGLTVSFAVLRQFDIVVIERLSPLGETFNLGRVGARLPANCTAAGKALLAEEDLDDLLAFMPERLPLLTPQSITDSSEFVEHLRIVRKSGVAREYGEAQVGHESTAMAVVVNGVAVGALTLSGPSGKAGGTVCGRTEEALRRTVRQLETRCTEFIGDDDERARLLPRTITDPAPWDSTG
ncbi:IclR family transcriptional regulator [Nocardioides zeae]|uniref:Helix-turn-helix domain-containing protein n=1 Tax=Nocardioides zeae TaxID=1457234 RepID=A0A6P0HM73_9ACTN|nr:IclR family transcriptional regulator C-terminal domain-containing protein [Nocardioides zeae]NEN79723.1 helix-turn-helix domain-containing protein [Nocardioides zeae]